MWIVLLCVLSLVVWAILWCVVKVRRQNQSYVDFNESEWHIDGLARPHHAVRLVNVVGDALPWVVDLAVYAVYRFRVAPALRRSLEAMKDAERANDEDGNDRFVSADDSVEATTVVPPRLCDARARADMERRIHIHHEDLRSSRTLTSVAKVRHLSAAAKWLGDHRALLAMGARPEVARERVREPVFIVSPPRTGTTILHRTMSLDRERFRNFDLCDTMSPRHAVPRWDAVGRAALAADARRALRTAARWSPGLWECMETMHGIRAEEACEDQRWYGSALGHEYLDSLVRSWPEHRARRRDDARNVRTPLEDSDVAEYRYAWLDMILRIFQNLDKTAWTNRTRGDAPERPCPTENTPWLLKDPNHAAYLTELLRQFPDARLIFSHRAPEKVIPSMAKLFTIATSCDHLPGAPGTTAAEWGREIVTRTTHYYDGVVNFTRRMDLEAAELRRRRRRLDEGGSEDENGDDVDERERENVEALTLAAGRNSSARRFDCDFIDVVRDVPGIVKIIYQNFYPENPEPSEKALAAFRRYLENNERNKRGNQSRRTLEDYHLTAKDLHFEEYNRMFFAK